MMHKYLAIIAAGMATMALTLAQKADACTGITLRSADGSVVMARTIEWALNEVPGAHSKDATAMSGLPWSRRNS